MELKLGKTIKGQKPSASFNRTFMELKLRISVPFPKHRAVLIAPLWN